MPHEINTIIIFSVVSAGLVILVITISVTVVLIILWKRNYKSSHVAVSNINEQVELQPNVCYTNTSFNFDNSKQQQYVF